MKPLLPTLRERKRYLVVEVVSEKPVTWSGARRAMARAGLNSLGEFGLSRAGLRFLDEKWEQSRQRGALRVAHTSLDAVRASLAFVQEIDGQPALLRSVGASGMLHRTERYLKEE